MNRSRRIAAASAAVLSLGLAGGAAASAHDRPAGAVDPPSAAALSALATGPTTTVPPTTVPPTTAAPDTTDAPVTTAAPSTVPSPSTTSVSGLSARATRRSAGATSSTAASSTTPAPSTTATSNPGNPDDPRTGEDPVGDVLDASFIRFAAKAGQAEVAFGTLAAEKATNPDTRAFAERMVTEHGVQVAEASSLAGTREITLSVDLDAETKADLADLGTLQGAAFDRAYLTMQAAKHHAAFMAFAEQARHGSDDCVQGWAARYLPTIADHLRVADQLLVVQSMDDEDGRR